MQQHITPIGREAFEDDKKNIEATWQLANDIMGRSIPIPSKVTYDEYLSHIYTANNVIRQMIPVHIVNPSNFTKENIKESWHLANKILGENIEIPNGLTYPQYSNRVMKANNVIRQSRIKGMNELGKEIHDSLFKGVPSIKNEPYYTTSNRYNGIPPLYHPNNAPVYPLQVPTTIELNKDNLTKDIEVIKQFRDTSNIEPLISAIDTSKVDKIYCYIDFSGCYLTTATNNVPMYHIIDGKLYLSVSPL